MAREAWGNDIDLMIGGCSNEGIVFMKMLGDKSKCVHCLEKSFNYAVPDELQLDIDSDECTEFGAQLKELYYGSEEPSLTNMEGYFAVSSH